MSTSARAAALAAMPGMLALWPSPAKPIGIPATKLFSNSKAMALASRLETIATYFAREVVLLVKSCFWD
jgi:hypothetical protein